ncbi:putative cytochrome P450 [Aspergillus carlsbadensis]|nr:putative cytochrome P450 [Aspergillus carlsbadensis]
MHLTTLLAVTGLLLAVYLATRRKPTSSLPLPPGPKPLPLIGNIHQAPKSHGWRIYQQWSKEYGPIVHVNMLGQHVIILSSTEVAHEILAKRGAAFSDRPRLFLANELALKGLNILMMNYTPQFRQHQRLHASVLNTTPAASYLPLQTLESTQLVHDLANNASNPSGTEVQKYFQRAIASIIHTLLYGFRIADPDDAMLDKIAKFNHEFSEFVQVGAHIVDILPVLNNLPGFLAPWKDKAERHFQGKYALRRENFQHALQRDAWNIAKYLKHSVEQDKLDMPMDELAFELGTIIDASLDGTTDSLMWFVVACVTQDPTGTGFIARALEEIERVVGRARMPVPEDRAHMPYVSAIVEEVLRWRPVGPEGVPHLHKEETTYNGYRIPANSVIVPNAWTISREEAVFGPDPEAFMPERWLVDADPASNPDTTSKDYTKAKTKTLNKTMLSSVSGFGYGRRTCPGRHFARNVIWIVIAQLLWAFDIRPGIDEGTGESIPVDPLACTYGLVMRSLPFKASFRARGEWVRDILGGGDTYGVDLGAMLERIGAEVGKA